MMLTDPKMHGERGNLTETEGVGIGKDDTLNNGRTGI